MAAAEEPVLVDGSFLEAGGQILRMGLALSAVSNVPIKVTKIRAGRSKPGLRAQHLKGLELARDMCNGRLDGGQIGSPEITFYPGSIQGGTYRVDTKTAGSVSLLIQAVLPYAVYAKLPSKLQLLGGTNAEMAPQVDYTQQVFSKVSAKFGMNFQLILSKRGFFPQGRGEVTLEINPCPDGLCSANITDFGEVSAVNGTAFVAGRLPFKIAVKMAESAEQSLRNFLPESVPIHVERIQESHEKAVGNGSGIVLWAKTTTGCILGGSALGKKGRPAEEDGKSAAKELMASITRKACVDQHAQDQIIILMALAKGKSTVRTGPLTDHSRTAIHVAELLTKAKFDINEIEDSDCIMLECEGSGQHPKW